MLKVDKRYMSYFDWELVVSIVLLCGVGLVILYSAGYDTELQFSPTFRRQFFAMLSGFAVFLLFALFPQNFWKRSSYTFFTIGCLSLVAVLIFGSYAGGAKRWLALGSIRIQPSEFTKLTLILGLARFCSKQQEKREFEPYTFKALLGPFFVIIIPSLLILKQPDLGTALGHILIGGSMLFVAGINRKTLFKLSVFSAAFCFPAWLWVLKDYQKKRILTFLNPEQDPLGAGYHAIQSKIAVGSGMMTGKGFMKGTQTQLSFLPEQTTDFVFSVLAEEWGFLGSIVVLILYFYLILRLLSIASQSVDSYNSFVTVGVAALIFWQVVVNIGMVIGVLPVVGLTLPLLSYGRSSLITVLAALGIVSGLWSRRFLFSR